jgi:hypothetical protein
MTEADIYFYGSWAALTLGLCCFVYVKAWRRGAIYGAGWQRQEERKWAAFRAWRFVKLTHEIAAKYGVNTNG